MFLLIYLLKNEMVGTSFLLCLLLFILISPILKKKKKKAIVRDQRWWRVINNGLPVSNNLCARGMTLPDFCPLCGSTSESLKHLLRLCTSEFHMRHLILPPHDSNPNTNFFYWIKSNVTSSSITHFQIPQGTLFLYLLWHL